MSVSIIEEIKINLVNYLIRWKKQIASALAVLVILLLGYGHSTIHGE